MYLLKTHGDFPASHVSFREFFKEVITWICPVLNSEGLFAQWLGGFHHGFRDTTPPKEKTDALWSLKKVKGTTVWEWWLHLWNLTWNLKRSPWKRWFLLETIIFRFHVKFRGSIHNRWIFGLVSWRTTVALGGVLVPVCHCYFILYFTFKEVKGDSSLSQHLIPQIFISCQEWHLPYPPVNEHSHGNSPFSW